MALTEAQKVRLSVAVGHLRRSAEWQTIRQFCVAESANDPPEYGVLSDYILNLLEKAVGEEIQNGVDARKARG